MEGNANMNDESIEFIFDAFQCSLKDVLEHYSGTNLLVEVRDYFDYHDTFASVVDFDLSVLSGSSVLLARQGVLESLFRLVPCNSMDWMGELNNQVIGRLKNKLARYNAAVIMHPPQNTRGSKLAIETLRLQASCYQVSCPEGVVLAMLSINLLGEVSFSKTPVQEVVEEGTMLWF